MQYSDAANTEELDKFLGSHPDTNMMEVLMMDLNGIPRGKRIPRREFSTLFTSGLKAPVSTALMNTEGDVDDDFGIDGFGGDPDKLLYPVAGTLSTVPWLASRPAQVIAGFREFNGESCHYDPRNVLRRALHSITQLGLKPVVATETEFYLLEPDAGSIPRPLLGRVPGTSIRQPGIQFGMMEDLWDLDGFLESVRTGAELQSLPVTTVLSEYSAGQFEINLHHQDEVLRACDQAVLLKRLIKGTARDHSMGASFMAKPFAGMAGCGLHIHISLYDQQGNNIFADDSSTAIPPVSEKMRHAIGGLAETMADNMAIFAPNANSYRRLMPESFVPLTPNWGYNHRSVSLRIPVSDATDTRIEHRVAGADANPYLVMAAILAGLHHGLTRKCDPGEMVAEGQNIDEEVITLPTRWESALKQFRDSEVMPRYLGEEYHKIYTLVKSAECEQYNARISPLDYESYLRAV
jgi:glutamine synthetase